MFMNFAKNWIEIPQMSTDVFRHVAFETLIVSMYIVLLGHPFYFGPDAPDVITTVQSGKCRDVVPRCAVPSDRNVASSEPICHPLDTPNASVSIKCRRLGDRLEHASSKCSTFIAIVFIRKAR